MYTLLMRLGTYIYPSSMPNLLISAPILSFLFLFYSPSALHTAYSAYSAYSPSAHVLQDMHARPAVTPNHLITTSPSSGTPATQHIDVQQ